MAPFAASRALTSTALEVLDALSEALPASPISQAAVERLAKRYEAAFSVKTLNEVLKSMGKGSIQMHLPADATNPVCLVSELCGSGGMDRTFVAWVLAPRTSLA